MKSQVLTRVLTLNKFVLGLFLLMNNYSYSQQPFDFKAPGGKWVPSSNPTTIPHRWEGNSGTFPWTLTPRTGLKDEVFPFYPNPDYRDFNNTTNIPGFARGIDRSISIEPISVLIDNDTVVRVKNSQYYISERVQGYMEYLPKDYNAPGNTQPYPLIIYFPGCGELGNGVFYTHAPSGKRTMVMPNYSRGLGRIMKPSGGNDLFNSLPRELLFNGDYFSAIPLKTPGQAYPAFGGLTQGVIVMACIVSGNQNENNDVCRKYMTPLNGDVEEYYRLTQVDRDGKSTITGVRKIYIGNSGFEVSIYPNVATSNINLDIPGLVNEALTVRVIDVAGRPLMQQVIAPRQNRVNLDVSKLSRGMYMVQVTGTSKNVVVKLSSNSTQSCNETVVNSTVSLQDWIV